MEITQKTILVRELTQGYVNAGERGVTGYNGQLDIRPPYQREFVYTHDKQSAVIHSVLKGYPLSVFYWADKGDDEYEVIDGQQRTLSLCEYVHNRFTVNMNGRSNYFRNLTGEEQDRILNYEIPVYLCSGSDRERLEWFEIINIAGETLTKQELLNANYTGPWLADARIKFSKRDCVAEKLSREKGDLLRGDPNRQDYLETVLQWIVNSQAKYNGSIADYMAQHQHDPDAEELLHYYKRVVAWVRSTFPTYYREMKGLPWGNYFNTYGQGTFNIDDKVKELMQNVDITKKRGVFIYLLSGEEKHLSLRTFDLNVKTSVFHRQNGICARCNQPFRLVDMHADHIVPWSKGGKTLPENCQVLCKKCNLSKAAK